MKQNTSVKDYNLWFFGSFKVFTALVAFTLSCLSYSGVNLKNGNFYMSYTDIVANSKGKTLALTRTYNSKSSEVGWFGFGWGTPYEVRVESSQNGVLIVYENGSAGMIRFIAKDYNPKDSHKEVNQLIAEIEKKNQLSGIAKKKLQEKLLKDPLARHRIAHKVSRDIKIKPGTVFRSEKVVNDEIEFTGKGYKRLFGDGSQQIFNGDGRLIATKDSSGYAVKLSYKASQVTKIEDNAGNQLLLDWTGDGFVKSVKGRGGQVSSYEYSGRKLVSAVNINKQKFSYEYDSNYNMTRITDHSVKDSKKNSMVVTYEPKTMFAESVRSRDGSITRYTYKPIGPDPDLAYSTTVIEDSSSGVPIASLYEYEHKRRPDGSLYLYRTKFITNGSWNKKNKKITGGVTKETVYHPDINRPVKVVHGDVTTEYEYDDGLLVSRKNNKGDFVKVTHKGNGVNRRIAQIQDNKRTIKYEWNKKNELAKAVASTGESLLLVYDNQGRVSKMVDQNSKNKGKPRILSFTYNALGKPSKISLENAGAITVDYDDAGVVTQVNPDKNPKVTEAVNSTFENFLNIVQPAGVNI